MIILEKVFKAKVDKFDECRTKLHTNHKFSQMYFAQELQKQKSYRNEILNEKVQWEKERDIIMKKMGSNMKRIVSLDVGGTHSIKTNMDLLCTAKGSLLE